MTPHDEILLKKVVIYHEVKYLIVSCKPVAWHYVMISYKELHKSKNTR